MSPARPNSMLCICRASLKLTAAVNAIDFAPGSTASGAGGQPPRRPRLRKSLWQASLLRAAADTHDSSRSPRHAQQAAEACRARGAAVPALPPVLDERPKFHGRQGTRMRHRCESRLVALRALCERQACWQDRLPSCEFPFLRRLAASSSHARSLPIASTPPIACWTATAC